MRRKGIIMAGGSGTRLRPLTQVVCKQLLPVYDKPLIYYPLSTLMSAGIRDILIISTPEDLPRFEALLGDGARLGASLAYAAQAHPGGLAEAFLIAADFLDGSPAAFILGDNIFWGEGLAGHLAAAAAEPQGATVFACRVDDPERFGIVTFDETGAVIDLEEKPAHPRSPYAVTGLYFYDERAVAFARRLRPSARGELEITDLNRLYLQAGELRVRILDRNVTWMDVGTHDALLQAAQFVQAVDRQRHGAVGCVEEVAWRQGWIGDDELLDLTASLANTRYGRYLRQLVTDS